MTTFIKQNANIQFTRVAEENGKLLFLDCLLSRDNNELQTTVYSKPTHTDRLLEESSYNPTSRKAPYYKDFDETRAASLWHTGKLTRRKQIPWTCFAQE